MSGDQPTILDQIQAHFGQGLNDTDNQENIDRVRYLRKLFFLLLLQLIFANWLIGESETNASFAHWVYSNKGWSFYIPLVLFIIIQLLLLFYRRGYVSSPVNYVFYFIHVVALGFVLTYWEVSRDKQHLNSDVHWVYQVVQYLTWVVFFLFVHSIYAKYLLNFQTASLYIFAAVFLESLNLVIYSDHNINSIIVLAVISSIWGFYLVWDVESASGWVKKGFKKEDFVTGSIAVYLNILLLVLGVADLIRQLIIKTRTN